MSTQIKEIDGEIQDVPSDDIFNMYTPIETRLDMLNKHLDPINVVSDLCCRYNVTPTSLIRKFLIEIMINSTINPDLKIEIGKTISKHELLKKLINEQPLEISTPCIIDTIIYILNEESEFQDSSKEMLSKFFSSGIESEYKYKTLVKINDTIYDNFSLDFFTHSTEPIVYRIMACQMILQKENTKHKQKACILLLNFCNDLDLDENVRADAADTLLHLGLDEYKEQARSVIIALGGRGVTVYENAQNVHNNSIESSVEKILIDVQYTPIKLSFKDMIEYLETNENYKKLEIALNRIQCDQTLHTNLNLTLEKIAIIIWNYIHLEESKDELIQRYIEELIDMTNTCTSGHVSRLVSVLSGYTKHNIQISLEDQMVANLSARFRNKMTDNDGDIMMEYLYSKEFDKPKTLEFFRKHISDIQNELYDEWKSLVDDEEFDSLMRNAIIKVLFG